MYLTPDKLTSRSGLAALAEPVRKLGLDAHFERLMPKPGQWHSDKRRRFLADASL